MLVAVPVRAPSSVTVAETDQMLVAQSPVSVGLAMYQNLKPQSYSTVVSDAPQELPVVVATHIAGTVLEPTPI